MIVQGGAIILSSGDNDGEDKTGGIAIIDNSTFEGCSSHGASGGVIFLNEQARLNITGDLNR